MNSSTKVAVAVASGYLLGRTKKLTLALTVGGVLAGRRVATDPQALLAQWSKLVEKSPELQKLQGQVTGPLVDAAKNAAVTTATHRIDSLSQSLSEYSGTAQAAGDGARKTGASTAKKQPKKKTSSSRSSSASSGSGRTASRK